MVNTGETQWFSNWNFRGWLRGYVTDDRNAENTAGETSYSPGLSMLLITLFYVLLLKLYKTHKSIIP